MRRWGHAHNDDNDDSAYGLQSMPRRRRSDLQALGRSKACLSHGANARRHPICFVLASMQRDRGISVETLCDCSAAATMSAVTQSPSHLLQEVGPLQVEAHCLLCMPLCRETAAWLTHTDTVASKTLNWD